MTDKQPQKKKCAFIKGGKGGTGKTTVACALADFYHGAGIPVTLLDADMENRSRGSLSHVFKGTPKINIRTKHGLDEFLDLIEAGAPRLMLADLGAGSGEDTFKWFDEMYEPLKDLLSFLAIGVVTTEAASVETLFSWSNELKGRTQYLVVRNHRNGDNFAYLEASEAGKQFLRLAKPQIIDLEARLDDIQGELSNRGLSLRQALEADPETAGPLLSKFSSKVRMRGYLTRIEAEFKRVIDVLLPPAA
jgi:hypothetical protein